MMRSAFHEILTTVRQTAAAHASALDELERAFFAETAKLTSDQEALKREETRMLQRVAEASALERALLVEEREALDRDRADLETRMERIAAVQPSSEEHFELNVGGVRFETSLATLTSVPSSMLATMFGARQDMLRRDPQDGSVFIDRNGERFGLILDYLRNQGSNRFAKTVRELPEEQNEAMMRELNFFGLTEAVFPRSWIEDAKVKVWGPKLNSRRFAYAAVRHGRRVIVFGGSDLRAALNTTEVLHLDGDGTTEMITAGPTMTTTRVGCAAVRLDARRVLVVGGGPGRRVQATALDTTETLDFETMRFSPGPRMLSKRRGCVAVALDARRVLVAGGYDENASPLRTTEILDVATMTFAPGPDMLSARLGCSAVALEGNPRRALIVGGRGSDNESLNTTEVLDLETLAFSRGPTMRTARFGCAAVPLSFGDSQHCLVIGGLDGATTLKTTEVLDLETMESTEGPTMLAEHAGCAAVVDAECRVLVLGGLSRDGADTEVLEAVRATRRRRGWSN